MISDRIKAHRSAPDVYEPPTFDQMANRIEELQAQNKRLETEAQLQAEEIDKTRRRADKWQSTVLDCDEYLKPGETPAERIQREINDCLALMKLLEKKQKRIEELEVDLRKLALDLIAADGQAMDAYQAQLEAEAKLAKAVECIERWLSSGCPDCCGDCSGANPPVSCCIVRNTLATIAELKGDKQP